MKVRVIQGFQGYPNGDQAAPVTYVAGQVCDVSEAFGKLVVEKGHAVPGDAAPAKPPAPLGADKTGAFGPHAR